MSVNDKLKNIDKIMGAINKKAGRTIVDRASNMMDQLTVEFIPTPSIAYNKILGGGFARKRISEIAGGEAGGKTSILLETIALDMKNDPESVWGWLETEASLEKESMCDMFGIDPDRFIMWHVDDEGAESALDILEALIRSAQFKGFVVNSVAGLTPSTELDTEMAKANVAVQARMMSKLMRKVTAITNKNNIAMVFTNQLRTDVGKMFGDPRVTTGGKALAFYASQRVMHSKVKVEASDGITDDDGMKVRVKVMKNRLAKGNPYVSADYLVRYGVGVDTLKETADLAKETNVVEGTSWLYYPNKEEATDEHKWQGMKNFLAYLEENPDFVELIKAEINARYKGTQLTEEEINAFQKQNAEAQAEMQHVEAELEEDGEVIGEEES